MRVLAVPQHVLARPDGGGDVRPAGLRRDLVRGVGRGEPGRYRCVVGSRVRVRLSGQATPLLQREPAVRQRGQQVRVTRRARHDRDRGVILGRRPDHGRTTDVDLLDALGRARTAGDRLLERVQVGDEQVERLDAELSELLPVAVLRQVSEQAGVHGRVQRLDPSIQALRESGHRLDGRDGHASGGDGRGCAARRHDLDAGRVQGGGELHQPALVVDADERPPDRHLAHSVTCHLLAAIVICRSAPSGPAPTSQRGPSGRRSPRRAPARPP